jgi:parvulin-like peptidyl-prolyl isomerase
MVCISILIFFAAKMAIAGGSLPAQELIDRIVARVDNDVILLSDIRALSHYQQLIESKSESDAQILDRLIDQWIVRSEADAAQFPRPREEEINRDIERLRKSFSSPEEYEARKKQVGLAEGEVRNLVDSQLYLSNYLDSRFRSSVQVSQEDIEHFYQEVIVPRAKARGLAAPSLDAARDQIQEALIQKGINEQADRWLNESRARLHVDKLLDEGVK